MTALEFLREFEIIYENINKNGAPGLDDFEISTILTHAQELLVKVGLQEDPSATKFSDIIDVFTDNTTGSGAYDNGVVFNLPTSYFKILNEKASDGVLDYVVLSIPAEEYSNKRSKAYKHPPRRRAWRLPLDNSAGSVEIVARSGVTLTSYTCKYVRKPKPIITNTLTDSIDGETAQATSELDPGLHRDIIKIASTLAEQYYMDKYGTDGNK